jgi:hypothetical protein
MTTPTVSFWRRPIGLAVVVVLAFGLTLAVAHLAGWRGLDAGSQGRSPSDVLTPAPGERPQLQLAIEADGRVLLAQPGRLALPKGARFAVRMQADRDGQFQLLTVNAAGQSPAQPLWQGEAKAGKAVVGPTLRTDGAGGTQTLRVLFLPQGGGLPREEQFTVWHP